MCTCLLFTFNWAENVMCFTKKKIKKRNYTFGYLNKGASWFCVGAEGGGCGVLSPELLQGVGLVLEGQGGSLSSACDPQAGCASPSEAPSQLQELQGWTLSFTVPFQGCLLL